MAGSKEVRAGSAYIELLAKDAALRKGLDNAGKTLKKWGDGISSIGKQFVAIGTAALVPLAATTKVFASMGDTLAKSSARTGVAVEELSALAYAADQSGTNLEGLETSLRKMSKTIIDAAQGGEAAQQSLEMLGLSVDQLKGLKPDQAFKLIADRLASIQDPTLKSALAMELFGKTGTQMLPMLADGAAGIEQLEQRARDLGLVWKTEDAKAAEEFGDRMDDLWKVVKQGTANIGSALVPVMRQLVVVVTDNLAAAAKWISTHRDVVVMALKIAAGVVAAGAGFLILGKAISGIGAVVGGVSSAIGVMGSVLSGIGGILSTVLFSGIGLVIAALGGLAAYFIYNSEVGQKAMGALGGYFGGLKDTALTAFGGIKDAMAAGDWKLAAEILWLGIKTAFMQGILPLQQAWAQFKGFFIKVGLGAWYGVQAGWEEVRTTLVTSWTNLVSFLEQLWSGFTGFIEETWDTIKSFFSNGLFYAAKVSGAIDQETYDALKAQTDREDALNSQARSRDEQAKAAKSMADANAKNEAEKKRHADAMAKIGAKANTDFQAISDETKRQIAENDANVANMKGQLQSTSAVAAVVGAAARVGNNFKKATTDFGAAPKLNFDDSGKTLDDLMKKTFSTRGAFGAAQLAGLGAVDPVVKNTAELVKLNRTLVQKVDNLAGEFV